MRMGIAAAAWPEDKDAPPEARVAAAARNSDEWYRKGVAVEPDKGYLYSSWATACANAGNMTRLGDGCPRASWRRIAKPEIHRHAKRPNAGASHIGRTPGRPSCG